MHADRTNEGTPATVGASKLLTPAARRTTPAVRLLGVVLAMAGALISAGSLLPWATATNSFMDLFDQSGLDLGFGMLTMLAGLAICGVGARAGWTGAASQAAARVATLLALAVLAVLIVTLGLVGAGAYHDDAALGLSFYDPWTGPVTGPLVVALGAVLGIVAGRLLESTARAR